MPRAARRALTAAQALPCCCTCPRRVRAASRGLGRTPPAEAGGALCCRPGRSRLSTGRTRHARRRPAGTDILPEATVEAICRPSRSLGVLTGESLSTPMPIVASYPQHARGGHTRPVIAPPTAVSPAPANRRRDSGCCVLILFPLARRGTAKFDAGRNRSALDGK